MFPLHDSLDEKIRKELGAYDDLTASLLSRRGVVTKADAERFLQPSYDLHLHDPLMMTDMPKAAERLSRAILSGEKIAVWSDYDCDGIPGAVLLHDFLKKVGAQFENYIPHRHLEGYGMNVGGIEKLGASGVKLIVTVDSGITDVTPVTRANEHGMEVIVTDHHLPGETLPPAYAVVNPNARADEKYSYKSLCGSGVAWKLVCAVLATSPTVRERVPVGWEKWLLDMVGLATIADMVPLTGENRLLATYGLIVMRKSPRLGLQKLCRGARVEQRNISEDDVGFMIAPRVNAASRMGDARDVFTLFTTDNDAEADGLVKKLEKANRERKASAGAITRAVHTRIKESGAVADVIVLGDPEWRPGLLGLVANTIAEEYERPVFLWGREGNMSIKGSVRSGDVHALDLMRTAGDVFIEFGGHAAAGGFTVRTDAIFSLEERLLKAYAEIRATMANEDPFVMNADAELALEEISPSFFEKVSLLAPFGMENPKPLFLLRNVVVNKISTFGKANEHFKLNIRTETGNRSFDAVTFFTKGNIARVSKSLTAGSHTHLLAHIERDSFSRTHPIRLRLIDIRAV